MTKKVYIIPKVRAIQIDTNAILAGSGSTNATGTDAPWAAKRSVNIIDDYEEE